MNIRVSATDIDAYRRFRSDEESDLATFLADMRKWTPPTPAMKAGTALHKALETAEPGEHGALVTEDGYRFAFDRECAIDLPDIRELKAERQYRVGPYDVTMVGKVDALHGRRIEDHKFTTKYDAERFLSSYQWRIYLEVFGADEFRWNVFEAREGETAKDYTITAVHALRTHRYPDMADDVERELGLWVDFVRVHLPERVKP